MPNHNNPRKRKYQLSLGLTEAESLNELRKETEASSLSEVVREALAFYSFAVDQTKKGGQISIQRADGATAEFSVRGIEVVRRAMRAPGNTD